MKMSDYFPLPCTSESLAYNVLYGRRPLGPTNGEAAAHAVNHHDALVEALTAILSNNMILNSQRRGANELLAEIKNDK